MMVPWPVEYTFEFGGAHQDVTITTSGHASAEDLIGVATTAVAGARSQAECRFSSLTCCSDSSAS
jgi:hypothetical protein